MIRFCDKDVNCVLYENLNREELLAYLFPQHIDETIYIFNKEGAYRGRIGYYSLVESIEIDDAISKEYVILNSEIWGNARNYFESHCSRIRGEENLLLPVLSMDKQLVWFAYQDANANREIRMLRELLNTQNALQFSDIYSEYQCVKIYEFNELAFLFAKYLECQKVAVQVVGIMWEGFFTGNENQAPDYNCLQIYAEGVGKKRRNWRENLLRSVSVEFECIDKIYETNIKNGSISDAKENCSMFLAFLRKEKEILLMGDKREIQEAYGFLLKEGIEVCGFVEEDQREQSHKMFGKKILSSRAARRAYQSPVFIDCSFQNSAWGFGETDYYDYIGYKRNERFFLLKDYVTVTGNSIINAMVGWRIVLIGDVYLCKYLYSYLKQQEVTVEGYWDILSQNNSKWDNESIDAENLDGSTMCLIVTPEFFDPNACDVYEEKKRQLIASLCENGISNYSDYFSYVTSFMNIEEENDTKYTKEYLRPKRIVLASIEGYSGNVFFEGLIDNHPSILTIIFTNLRNRLYWICLRLSMESTENILPLFWEICKTESVQSLDNPSAFCEKMEQLLAGGDRFTSQELFVMCHIAFIYMYGRDIGKTEIENMIIFWEPHCMERIQRENYVVWLCSEEVPCDILNLVRNICMTKGTTIKEIISKETFKNKAVAWNHVINYPRINARNYKWCNKLVVKFEDLKCNPQETLLDICNKWGIEWSDTLLMTTCHGVRHAYYNGEREISDFDLEPVYNTYDKYLSEFDRMRIMLINAPWQKEYGYPYVDILDFSKREIQEMFLKKFRFEDAIEFADIKSKLDFYIWLQGLIQMDKLQKVRMLAINGDNRAGGMEE